MSKRHGGPAFPRPAFYPDDPAGHMDPGERRDWSHCEQEGMTLRDYVAVFALQAVIAHPLRPGPDDQCKDGCAQLAFEYADAFLKAREQ